MMHNSIREALEFMRSGATTANVVDAIEKVGEKNVRVILTELFGWMKRQQRFNHEKPLELRNEFAWCQNLATFLESKLGMNELFEITGNQLVYQAEVDQETRVLMRGLVTQGYQPTLRPMIV